MQSLSPQRRLKRFSLGGEDLLSNVSAGTRLPEMAERTGASTRHQTQDGHHPGGGGGGFISTLLVGVACLPCVSQIFQCMEIGKSQLHS